MKIDVRRLVHVCALVAMPVVMSACSWFSDFKRQPAIHNWEPYSKNDNDTTTPPRGQPKYSVPMQGTLAAAYAISNAPIPATLDSFANIASPIASDDRSLANGKQHYQINCAVCHGAAGDANGGLKRVNAGYAFAPSLLTPQAKGRTTGYVYGMMRNGRGVMPNYNRIEEADRWDVANYVKALQAGTADTLPGGMPGQNGTTVPGPSATAPTLPARFVIQKVVPTRGSPGLNSATVKGAHESGGAATGASKEKKQ